MTTMAGVPKWRGFVVLFGATFGLLTGLCTLFALVVTSAQAWQEHVQAQWPEVTAQVQRCAVDLYTYKPRRYWIDCSISYPVQGEQIVSHVHSRSIRDPRAAIFQSVLQNPIGQFDRVQQWVGSHPQGAPIVVHYDPANPRKTVLPATTDMPKAGPRTPDNLKLLGFLAVSCAAMLGITRIAYPKSYAGGVGG